MHSTDQPKSWSLFADKDAANGYADWAQNNGYIAIVERRPSGLYIVELY